MTRAVHWLAALTCLSILMCLAGCAKSTPPADQTAPPTPPKMTKAAPPASNVTLTLFAGAASKPATVEAIKAYEAKTGVKVEATYGGSGTLLNQIAQEQYGDIYLPGSDDFMDKAEEKGAVDKTTRTIIVYLVPEILVEKGNPKKVKGLDDLARKDLRVVLAQPKAVCLGDASEAMLAKVGLWEKVKPKVASFASSCEDTLNALLLGEADAIIAWDAYPKQHPDKIEGIPIPMDVARTHNIPAAVITWSKQPEEARKFIEFLASPEGKAIYDKFHYTTELKQ